MKIHGLVDEKRRAELKAALKKGDYGALVRKGGEPMPPDEKKTVVAIPAKDALTPIPVKPVGQPALPIQPPVQPPVQPPAPQPVVIQPPQQFVPAKPPQHVLDRDFLDAAKAGDIQKAEAALRAGARFFTKDQDENDALILAVKFNHPLMVAFLIQESGARGRITPSSWVNAVNLARESAMSIAVEQGNLEICKLLKAAGAFIDGTNPEGHTHLMVAAFRHPQDTMLLELFLEGETCVYSKSEKEEYTALMVAAKIDHAWLVDRILQKIDRAGRKLVGVDIRDRDGFTALMHAVSGEHNETMQSDIIRRLLEAGADKKVIYDTKTIEDIAIENGYFDAAKQIHRYGRKWWQVW